MAAPIYIPIYSVEGFLKGHFFFLSSSWIFLLPLTLWDSQDTWILKSWFFMLAHDHVKFMGSSSYHTLMCRYPQGFSWPVLFPLDSKYHLLSFSQLMTMCWWLTNLLSTAGKLYRRKLQSRGKGVDLFYPETEMLNFTELLLLITHLSLGSYTTFPEWLLHSWGRDFKVKAGKWPVVFF